MPLSSDPLQPVVMRMTVQRNLKTTLS